MITTTLAYFPSPAQGVWHLGPFPLRAYALFIIVGIIVAVLLGDRRWTARGGERGVIYDIALWPVLFGLVGGRLYHVLTDWKTYFGPDGAGPMAALLFTRGGLGIWGAVALGGVGAWIACRRRGIPLPAFGDAIAPGIVLAQAIGRLGNYFNQELYGRETTVPWGLEIFYRRDPSGILDVHSLEGVSTGQVAAVVHPTFLYEMLWNLLIFVALLYIDRRFKIGHGRLFALYVAGYCVGRFCIELMRDDVATHIAGIRINSFTATFVFIGAVVYFILAPKGREDPATLGGDLCGSEDQESVAEELADELVAAAATTGVIAAATVAGREDEPEPAAAVSDPAPELETPSAPEAEPEVAAEAAAEAESAAESGPVPEPAAEAEPEPEPEPAEPEPEPEPAAAEPEPESRADPELAAKPEPAAEEPTPEPEQAEAAPGEPDDSADETDVEEPAPDEAVDEAVVEAEAAADGLQTTTIIENEGAVDEDDDRADDDDLEGANEVSSLSGPLSEQQEEFDRGADEEFDGESGEFTADIEDIEDTEDNTDGSGDESAAELEEPSAEPDQQPDEEQAAEATEPDVSAEEPSAEPGQQPDEEQAAEATEPDVGAQEAVADPDQVPDAEEPAAKPSQPAAEVAPTAAEEPESRPTPSRSRWSRLRRR